MYLWLALFSEIPAFLITGSIIENPSPVHNYLVDVTYKAKDTVFENHLVMKNFRSFYCLPKGSICDNGEVNSITKPRIRTYYRLKSNATADWTLMSTMASPQCSKNGTDLELQIAKATLKFNCKL